MTLASFRVHFSVSFQLHFALHLPVDVLYLPPMVVGC